MNKKLFLTIFFLLSSNITKSEIISDISKILDMNLEKKVINQLKSNLHPSIIENKFLYSTLIKKHNKNIKNTIIDISKRFKLTKNDLYKIFLGITPAEHRKYLKALFKYTLKDRPKICITTCGEFHLVKTALDAGYKRENVVCSDISLFSSLLGYYYTNKPIDSLGVIVNEPFKKIYKDCKRDVEKVATLFLIMKTQQINDKVYYENIVKEELLGNRKFYINSLITILEGSKANYEGIRYEIRDIRDEIINPEYNEDYIWTTDPPMYSGDYSKMFDFKEAIVWNSGIKEFNLKEEYLNLLKESKKQKHIALWLKYKDVIGIDKKSIIYALEQKDRYDYWITTKPKYFDKFKYKNYIKFKSKTEVSSYGGLKIMADDDTITKKSSVNFVYVSKEIALYYRDLFCHRLGTTAAEHYFLVLIDGKIFCVIGVFASDVLKMKTDKFSEVFGMTANLKKYPRSTRLMMYFLTSREMKKVLIPRMSKVNRIYKLSGVKSTSFTRFGRDKTNANLLKRVSKEKMPDGYYKIQYESEFYNRN